MKTFDTLDLLPADVSALTGDVLGNHSVYLASCGAAFPVKIPFQWGGDCTKRTRQEPGYPRSTIQHEVAILRALAERQMAPPIGEWVFFRNVVSDYPGAWWCDPVGALGFEMANARALPPGRFSIEEMRRLPIEGSPGAWNDILVPERQNIINGYLCDVRRTGWDMLRWGGELPPLPDLADLESQLVARVHREGQFPPGERAEAYQDFCAGGAWYRGQRRVEERARLLGLEIKPGESVLDIGTQTGGFLQWAYSCVAGNGRFVGVDVNPAYIDCARALARSCGQNICYRVMDAAKDREAFLAWVRALFPQGLDHLLCLSLEKHFDIFPLIDAIGARKTYIESNAVAKDDGVGPAPGVQGKGALDAAVVARGGRHVGWSRDRNLRALYVIGREP